MADAGSCRSSACGPARHGQQDGGATISYFDVNGCAAGNEGRRQGRIEREQRRLQAMRPAPRPHRALPCRATPPPCSHSVAPLRSSMPPTPNAAAVQQPGRRRHTPALLVLLFRPSRAGDADEHLSTTRVWWPPFFSCRSMVACTAPGHRRRAPLHLPCRSCMCDLSKR